MDLWIIIIPSVAFFAGMATVGAYIKEGLGELGEKLALRDVYDDNTISELAPGPNPINIQSP